jgi:hypothetical protein
MNRLIKNIKKDQEIINENGPSAGDEKTFSFMWLGQSGFLLQWKGKRVS